MSNRRKKKQPPLSALDQFNNFCKAMGEQELFEAGVFPNATDAGDVRDELTRLARPFTAEEKKNTPRLRKAIKTRLTDPNDRTATKDTTMVEPKGMKGPIRWKEGRWGTLEGDISFEYPGETTPQEPPEPDDLTHGNQSPTKKD
jgi:hypothetical protein